MRRARHPGRRGGTLAPLLLGLGLLAACRPTTPAAPPTAAAEPLPRPPLEATIAAPEPVDRSRYGPPIADISAEPEVRVRVVADADVAIIGPKGQITLGGADGRSLALAGPLTISRSDDDRLAIRDRRGRTTRVDGPITVTASPGADLEVGGRAYPGALLVHLGADGLDVVNHLPLERYLPGVLDRELPRGWPPAAFRAQAIAARSYALWERGRAEGRTHDLEATTASQVYGGRVDNPRAADAVRETRGQVLVYDAHVVPAFYSSAQGRLAQDAAIAFPGIAPDIAPLRGGERGEWDAASPKDRWGPLTRDRAGLAARLAAWGSAHDQPIAGLSSIAAITVTRRSAAGRPAEFTITDGEGVAFTLPAESFRHAANHRPPALERAGTLWSSDVDVAVGDAAVVFTNGRGFGHGVGLSQWGARALAESGRDALEILGLYYPGAAVLTIYP